MKQLFVLFFAFGAIVSSLHAAITVTPTSTSDFVVTNSSGASIVNPATGVITSGAGSGLITLRSAVIAANANSGSTINIPAGTYTLTIAGDDGDGDPNPAIGDLDVLASITIKGAGPATTIIQAGTTAFNGIDQIFTLNSFFTSTQKSAVVNGFTASVSGITFRNGKCANQNGQSGSFVGGAISFDAGYNNGAAITPGSMSVSNCVFDSCSSRFGGGAVVQFDGGTVTYTNCLFTNNGIAFATATNLSGIGGAIQIGNTLVNSGTTTIGNCTFVNNTASAGGAIGAFGGTPNVLIHNCLIANNTAQGSGGGIYSLNIMTIDQGTIISNNLSQGINNNAAEGGGIYLGGGPATISNCTIVSNVVSLSSADQRGGGGIAAGSVTSSTNGVNTTDTIVNCRIFGNIATATNGTGLHKDGNPGTVTANDNWWGNNGGPGVGGANTAVLGNVGSGGGALNLSTWLVMTFAAAPTTLLTGGTSALTASITKNSVNATGFTVPNATPVTFGGVLGTDSPASTTLTSGTATSTFTAGTTGGTGSASATVDAQTLSASLTINQPPLITSATNTTFTVLNAGAFPVTKVGVPIPSLSANGTLPSGVGFNPGTGNLSGTPAANTGGSYPLVFTATNSVGANIQNFTLTVDQAAAFNSASAATFTVGSNGTFNVSTIGFPVPTVAESGTLPSGVAFNAATKVLSGTPGAGTGGTYPITFTAHNGVGVDGTQNFTLTVKQAASVTCPANIHTNATGGVCQLPSVPFAATFTGFPAPTVSYKLGASPITSPFTFPIGTNTVTTTATNSVGTNTCSFTVTVAPGPEPQLTLVRSGANKAVVSWNSSYGCYTLQTASSLKSNSWSAYPGPFATNGGLILVTNTGASSNTYFRLFH